MQGLVDRPLTKEALSERYRALCEDPLFANVPGKIEIDPWGRLILSPPSNLHGMVQVEMARRLGVLGGRAFAEASVLTHAGVLVADVAWASSTFMAAHGVETPFSSAPEICIEIVSPSNSTKEMREKTEAYLAAGAVEVWIAHPQSKRVEYFGGSGALEASVYPVDLTGVMD
jgi:Uma2 family endonuclease